jgi:hypothetical protein
MLTLTRNIKEMIVVAQGCAVHTLTADMLTFASAGQQEQKEHRPLQKPASPDPASSFMFCKKIPRKTKTQRK